MAKQTVAIDLQATTKGAESVKSLKQQIKEAQAEAIQLSRKFGDFSPEATKAAQRVATLRDEMEDFQKRVEGLNPDKFGRIATIGMTVANGFQAAQGAMALFGAESEDVQKQLAKVQGAIAFAQGIDGILAMSNSLKAMGAEALNAFKSIRTGLLATGIGAFVVALGTIIAYWDDIKEAVNGVSKEQEDLNKKTKTNLQTAQEQIEAVDKQENILKLQGKSEKDILKIRMDKIKAAIKLAEADLANAKATKNAQIDAAKRNKDILVGILKFLTAPLQLLLTTVDKVGKVLGKDFNLQEKFNTSVAKLIFDPEEVRKEGDKTIKEAEDVLTKLKNDYAGYQLQVNKINEDEAKANAENRKKSQEEKEAQIQAELEKNATLLALQQNTLEEQIAAADAAFATQIADLKKRNYSEIEINKLRDAALEKVRKDYYDKKKVDDEKAAKEAEDFRNKANESLLRAQESYYTDLKTKLIQNNATQAKLDALELERLEANLTAMQALYGENSDEAIKATAELVAKKKELYDIDVKNKEEAEKALREAQLQTLSATASAISAMGALFKEGSDAAKAAALADIAINTGVGFVQGLDIAQKSAKATGPAAAFAFPIFYATQIAAVLGAASRARSILKVGGNDGGGNKPPAPPSFNAVPLTSGMLPENENAAGFAGMGRVYVLEGDITNTQRRVRRIKNVSVV